MNGNKKVGVGRIDDGNFVVGGPDGERFGVGSIDSGRVDCGRFGGGRVSRGLRQGLDDAHVSNLSIFKAHS